MKVLHKILWVMVYAFPAVLFFSYYPIISLGSNNSMNFELSLPLIWLAVFDVLAFIWMVGWGIQQRRLGKLELPGISDRRFFLLALFPLYVTVSVLWSANRLRGLLTIAVMWAIFFAVFAILFILPLGGKPRKLRTHVLLVFLVSAVLVCKFCYAQSIMDILGVDREHTLLCLGCTYRSFGFPHPSGFAIEPQFMGNLLLAPTLTALYLLVFHERKAYQKLTADVDQLETVAEQKVLRGKLKLPHLNWARWRTIGMIILSGFLSMTLFFTFSRGAIYAYAVGLLVLLIFAIKRKVFRWRLIAVPVVSFVLALGLQGTFAAVGPTVETFGSAVAKSIHQLSLGIIDFRAAVAPPKAESVDKSTTIVENLTTDCGNLEENSATKVDNSVQKVEKDHKTVENVQNADNKKTPETCIKPIQGAISIGIDLLPADAELPVDNHSDSSTGNEAIFEGYVAESTNIRMKFNKVALKTWLAAPGHQLSSIGLNCGEPHFFGDNCEDYLRFSRTSILFGVGIGGAGTAMHAAYPEEVTSPKEIVQHEGLSLLLETGLVGIGLMIFGLLVAFWPGLFSSKFIDGRAAAVANAKGHTTKVSSHATTIVKAKPINTFWQHPALPLLLSLVIAYLITLNFFSGLPNALQIYLMPPLLYLIFQNPRNIPPTFHYITLYPKSQ